MIEARIEVLENGRAVWCKECGGFICIVPHEDNNWYYNTMQHLTKEHSGHHLTVIARP